jgi:uncharacterized RmlC-like cupin family protein
LQVIGHRWMRSASRRVTRAEADIYVVSGTPSFVFLGVDAGEPTKVRIDTRPGDHIIVPPFVPHREGNPAPDVEAIVVNLDEPAWPVG